MPDISNKDQTRPSIEDNPSQTNDDLNELRKHLLGPVQALIERLRERLDNPEIYAESVSRVLPEAIRLRQKQDRQVAQVLGPAIEEIVKDSMHKDRRAYLDTLFPILGPTLRRVIRSPYVWTAIILLLGAIGFRTFETYQNYHTWQLYYDRLRAEPGIVITGIEKRAGKNHVFGFRDPLSVDPVKILMETALESRKIVFHWEHYYSLQPAFVFKRVRTILRPPDTVTLEFKKGILMLTGSALGQWFDDARRLSEVIPGISGYQDEGLVDISQRLDPPPTVWLELKNRVLVSHGSAFIGWSTSARHLAGEIPGITEYRDENVMDIARVLSPPKSIKLKVNGRILMAQGAALTKWISQARKRANTMAGISSYRDDEVLDIERVLNPPQSVSLEIKKDVLVAHGAALHEWIADARKLVEAIPEISDYQDNGVVDINAKKTLNPPATIILELRDGILVAYGSAFPQWIAATRKLAKKISWIKEYQDDEVVDIHEVLNPPATIILELKKNVLVARGSALEEWIARARRLAEAIPGIEGYRENQVVNIQQALRPPATISLELKKRVLAAYGCAFGDWIDAARKVVNALPEISIYQDDKVVDIEQVLHPPATVKLTLNNKDLVAHGSAFAAWIKSARELAKTIPIITAYKDKDVIDIHKKLKPPNTITLTLKGTVLHAQGSASQQWIIATRRLVKSMPEFSNFDEDILVLSDPGREIKMVRKKIENQYLLFNSNQTRIAPDQENAIVNLVRDFYSLFDLAQVLERRVRIEVIGHTDTTGSYRDNLRLGQKRAKNIVNLIVSKGFDRKYFTVTPVDPKKPLRNESNESDKRLNRSVSFKVKLFMGLEPTS